MKNLIQKLSLLFIVMTTVFSASAFDFEVDSVFYTVVSLEDLTCEASSAGKYNPRRYAGEVVIPREVTYNNHTFKVIGIGDWIFRDCEFLVRVDILCPLTKIPEFAFSRCYNLRWVTYPETVTRIDPRAFEYCMSLKSYTFPKNLTRLADPVFSDCYQLQNITIPDGVTTFETSFTNCDELTTIEVGSTVTKLCLSECTALKVLKLHATEPPLLTGKDGGFSNRNFMNVTVQVPQESLEDYRNAEIWKKFWNIEPLK